MSSNDLLSYSIMHSGRKALIPAPSQMYYMPLRGLPSLGSVEKKEAVVLPPLHNFSRFAEPGSKHNLTENNLLRFGKAGAVDDSPTPSLTSASSVETSSPDQSPRMGHSATQVSEYTNPLAATNASSSAQKRRQRQGPSCDSCRSRKVKCDADIMVVGRNHSEFMKELHQFGKAEECLKSLSIPGTSIQTPEKDTSIILVNNKLIKFTSCKSCNNKGVSCKFSKGYTKEDIMLNTKKSNTSDSDSHVKNSIFPTPSQRDFSGIKNASRITKSSKRKSPGNPGVSSRKSSCISCRKRKVKCVYNSSLKKCESCFKKIQGCTFEDSNHLNATPSVGDIEGQKDN